MFTLLAILAQDDGGGSAIGGLLGLVVAVLVIAGLWKVFTKAGQPGWAAIIPIYNLIVLLQIAGKPIWWIVLMIIPFVNFVIIILTWMGVAQAFGKGVGFALGLTFLSPIFVPWLGFGDARYSGAPA
jgi:hypothetical protein